MSESQTHLFSDNPISFRRSKDPYGAFSNMSGGYPITVNDMLNMPKKDADDNDIFRYMFVGGIGYSGLQQTARVYINHAAPRDGVTFKYERNWGGQVVKGEASIPEGSHDIGLTVTAPESTATYPVTFPITLTPVDPKWKLAYGESNIARIRVIPQR